MELSVTTDGYVKCVIGNNEQVVHEQITMINSSNLSLPCMMDRYDEKILYYHIGGNVSLFEYIKRTLLDFESLKELVINLANTFIMLEEKGLDNKKIVADIRYIYINPSTKKLSVMQCPIYEYGEVGNFQKIVNTLCYNINSKNAYVAIGYILEQAREANFDIRSFVRMLQGLKNAENKKQIEYQKEVEYKIVEKKITINKTSYILSGFISLILSAIGIILLPYIFENTIIVEPILADVISFIIVGLVTIIVFIILKIANNKNDVQMIEEPNMPIQQSNARVESKTYNTGVGMSAPGQKNNIDSRNAAKMVSEETTILEEDVEINPIKRQELYQREKLQNACLIDENTKKKYMITKNIYIIGRSSECDLVLNDTIISKKHAEIVFENNCYYVRDLKSSNNTYLNKAIIEPMELYKIEDNARIGFGNNWFIFKIVE